VVPIEKNELRVDDLMSKLKEKERELKDGHAVFGVSQLTKRQADILNFIISYIGDNSYPPTYREIGYVFEIKQLNAVRDHLRALERKGYIRLERMTSRGIEVLKDAEGKEITYRMDRENESRMVKCPECGQEINTKTEIEFRNEKNES
jgi:repressor LexA